MHFSTINGLTRLYYLLSLFIVYLIKNPILYFYITFFFVSVEILLLKKTKSNTTFFKFPQLLFIGFVSYVLLVRSFVFNFSDETNYNLNTIEHLLFAVVICLLIFYYILFFSSIRKNYAIVLSFLIFNCIGLFNEFFQNYFQGKPVFILDEFSVKDLIANVLGTIIFVIIMRILKTRMSVLNSLEK